MPRNNKENKNQCSNDYSEKKCKEQQCKECNVAAACCPFTVCPKNSNRNQFAFFVNNGTDLFPAPGVTGASSPANVVFNRNILATSCIIHDIANHPDQILLNSAGCYEVLATVRNPAAAGVAATFDLALTGLNTTAAGAGTNSIDGSAVTSTNDLITVQAKFCIQCPAILTLRNLAPLPAVGAIDTAAGASIASIDIKSLC